MAPALLALTLSMTTLATALADVVTLDTGAQVEGHISHYEHAGDCGIEVDGGELAGALLVVPCERVVRFERSPEAVAVVPLSSPLSAGPPDAVVGMAAVVVPGEAAPIADASAAAEPAGPVETTDPPSAPTESAVAAAPEPEPEPVPTVAAEPEPVPTVAAEPKPEDEPAVAEDSTDAGPEPTEEAATSSPAGWRAALPEGIALPEFVRKRRE